MLEAFTRIRPIPCSLLIRRTFQAPLSPLQRPWEKPSPSCAAAPTSIGPTSARPRIFQADGGRTGSLLLAGEELTLNSRGESVISYADFALAMIDEIVKGSHIKERISVVRK